ncbi:MAG: GxxExxY protein [Flavisolibacter sp.]
MEESLKHSELTGKIIGCAMKVHRTMGPGYQEIIYARCMAIEMERSGISFQSEVEWPIYYDEYLVGKKRIDFLVEDKIALELKAIYDLGERELVQGLNYLESYHLDTGLLINFGSSSLQFKRLFNKHKNKNPDP